MTRDEFRQAVIDQYSGPAISAAWAADAALAVLDAEQLTPVRVIGLAPWTLTELIVGDLEEVKSND